MLWLGKLFYWFKKTAGLESLGNDMRLMLMTGKMDGVGSSDEGDDGKTGKAVRNTGR
jgi:hypothetical protein